MTVFDAIEAGFASLLSTGPAVSGLIEVNGDPDFTLPEGTTAAVVISAMNATAQPLGGFHGNPIDRETIVVVRCFASAIGTSARPAANALAASVYARLFATPDLGLGVEVDVGEPDFSWNEGTAARRFATAILSYTVTHRTSGGTLN